MRAAVGAQTATMMFFNANGAVGEAKAAQFVENGKKHNVPTFNDKELRGPQSARIVMARKDLIEAAMLNSPADSACWRPSSRVSNTFTRHSGRSGNHGASSRQEFRLPYAGSGDGVMARLASRAD